MATTTEKRSTLARLHVKGDPLLMPNPWDRGSARLLASLGYLALATTSGGFASTLGRPDYSVSRDEALEHARSLVAAVDLPVSADLENGYSHDPVGVAQTVRSAVEIGLAGCSIEDFTTRTDDPIYELPLARERIAAAAEAAHADRSGLMLTARAENHLRGRHDIADTITRLQAYQEAGADVLYAPALSTIDDIRSVVESVDRPVNVLVVDGSPSVAELSEVGVARVSVGGWFNQVAMGALARAGRELISEGTYEWMIIAREGRSATREAMT
jgi:2-methylisocitrate lyase-like PEP mutase family enzyme